MAINIIQELQYHFIRTLPYIKETALECMCVSPIYKLLSASEQGKYWCVVRKPQSSDANYDIRRQYYDILQESALTSSVSSLTGVMYNIQCLDVKAVKYGNTPQLHFTFTGNKVSLLRKTRFICSTSNTTFYTPNSIKFTRKSIIFDEIENLTYGVIDYKAIYTNILGEDFDEMLISDLKLYTDYGNIASGLNGIKNIESVKKIKIVNDVVQDYNGTSEDGISLLFSTTGIFNFNIDYTQVILSDDIIKQRGFIYFKPNILSVSSNTIYEKVLANTLGVGEKKQITNSVINFENITIRNDISKDFQSENLTVSHNIMIMTISIYSKKRFTKESITENTSAVSDQLFRVAIERILKLFPPISLESTPEILNASEAKLNEESQKGGYVVYKVTVKIPFSTSLFAGDTFNEAENILTFESKFNQEVYGS